MKNMDWTVEEIKSVMEKFSKLDLGCFDLSDGEFKLKLEARPVVMDAGCHPQAACVSAESLPGPEKEPVCGNVITSPIVGTFYASSSPEKPPFVKVGSKVNKDDVVLIIESMKLMNEVKSDFSGCVAEIYVENGTPVEFGQPLMRIE